MGIKSLMKSDGFLALLAFLGIAIFMISMEKQVSIWVYLLNASKYSSEIFYVDSCREVLLSKSHVTVLHGSVGGVSFSRRADRICDLSGKNLEVLRKGNSVLEVPVLFAPSLKNSWGLLKEIDDLSMVSASYKSLSYLDAIVVSFFSNSVLLAVLALLFYKIKNKIRGLTTGRMNRGDHGRRRSS